MKNKTDEHLTAAEMAFELMLFLPVFLTNLVGIFKEGFFDENKLFFPGLLVVDVIMFVLFYYNFKDRTYRGENIYRVILLLVVIVCLIGIIITKFFK